MKLHSLMVVASVYFKRCLLTLSYSCHPRPDLRSLPCLYIVYATGVYPERDSEWE